MIAYLMMMVATEACGAEWYNVKWTTQWKGCQRKWSWPA